MMDSIKKIGLSLVVTGALGVSVNAVCVSEKYCSDYHVGVGGFYENMSANEANINRAGGFISFGAYDTLFQRFHYGAEMKIGYGNTNLSGAHLSQFNKNTQLLQVELMPKIGVNLLKGTSSLFINLFLGTDAIISSSNGIGRLMVYVGPELEGKLKVSERVKLTYSFGYGYLGAGYVFDGSLARVNGYNQVFIFSLGTQAKVSENVSFYLKGFGKYYDLNASKQVNGISMPDSRAWQAGLEAGVAF
ncbi:hypothetical protein [Helicobacter trogontum]|nr:hypothetical protein [Helicobacter trogontum]